MEDIHAVHFARELIWPFFQREFVANIKSFRALIRQIERTNSEFVLAAAFVRVVIYKQRVASMRYFHSRFRKQQ